MTASAEPTLPHISAPPLQPRDWAEQPIPARRRAVELHRRLYGRVDFETGLSSDFLAGNYGNRREGER
jgi:hypothetical protein